MTGMNPTDPKKSGGLSARRLALLASVAGLGAFALLAGPGFYRPAGLDFGAPPARAAEATLPHPAGFADIVAKVKPAVISVRVKTTATGRSPLPRVRRCKNSSSNSAARRGRAGSRRLTKPSSAKALVFSFRPTATR